MVLSIMLDKEVLSTKSLVKSISSISVVKYIFLLVAKTMTESHLAMTEPTYVSVQMKHYLLYKLSPLILHIINKGQN